MATLSDVAARAGVSISAVSRVLSDSPDSRVTPATRQRIEDAARDLDYHPNFTARALKRSRTQVVALVVPDLTNAIFAELMRGVEETAHELGYMVLLARAESMRPVGPAIAKLVGEGRVDGVLLQLGDAASGDVLEPVLTQNVPLVLVNSRRDGFVGSVTLPDGAASRIAVEHLRSLGHTAIAHIGGLPSTDSAERRAQGFSAALLAAGLPQHPAFVTRLGYEPRQGREALRRLLALPDRPSAIVVANVNAAMGVLAEARSLGVRVPEELSIVAIHDAWTAENSWPPLTTINMPLYDLGRLSMTALVERISSGRSTDSVAQESALRLVIRESTSPR
jgi:LacI family transcriptional regulator